MKSCSVLIRGYNEEEHIGRLLSGILQQTVKDVQIILVDSGSTDATLAIASRYPVEIVQINPQDFTFGRSLNMGMAHAVKDLVVIASAHVYPVYPDWLEQMLLPFDDPQVALTYGKQRAPQSAHFSENQIWRQWYPDEPRPNQNNPFCNNANAAIRRSLWQEHPYDETLSGLEDMDWARWAQEQSYTIVYVPEAEVKHLHHENWHGIYNRYKREGMAFKHIYPQEKFGLGDLIRLWFVNVANDFRAASKEKVLGANWARIMAYRFNQFLGTYHGYRRQESLTWELRRAYYYPRLDPGNSNHTRNYAPIRYQDEPGSQTKPVEENK
ncbi:MAG: glycosyltransferase family 2 protein [Chloroflexi bacterium]|nr:glycosyltransferase family 2 protein [Chloroflexota bacterium]